VWYYFRLTVWACIWLVAWTVTFPFRRGRDNCLTWSLRQIKNNGGYLVVRWSVSEKVPAIFMHPHFAWLPPGEHSSAIHYVPGEGTNEGLVPSLWFNGIVEKGDRNVHHSE
jgi:hypothetical protein